MYGELVAEVTDLQAWRLRSPCCTATAEDLMLEERAARARLQAHPQHRGAQRAWTAEARRRARNARVARAAGV